MEAAAAAPSLKEITAWFSKMALLEETELEEEIAKDREGYIELLVATRGFIAVLCGQPNKLSEKITTLKLQETHAKTANVKHINDAYGGDIKIQKKGKEIEWIEDKSAYVKAANNYKTNWNFRVNLGLLNKYIETPAEETEKWLKLEEEMILDLYRKMKNGKAILSCFSKKGEENRYEIDGFFIALLCVKIARDSNTGAVNFGCERCRECRHYHRILQLQKHADFVREVVYIYPDLLLHPKLDCLSENEWTRIRKGVTTHGNCHLYQ